MTLASLKSLILSFKETETLPKGEEELLYQKNFILLEVVPNLAKNFEIGAKY
jgi:hypothetical protein